MLAKLRGYFPASKQGQLENFQEAVNIGESNQPKPAALLLDRSKEDALGPESVFLYTAGPLRCHGAD